ncbi:PREDICTED: zinc finger protein PLAG1 isoform X3 [Haliaeetus leucocephalus]|uniref:zinc finger protein PLAG1 isoform X3 n=1 Tax=Haliaeetus leucocephalus TaxID=52644 RepID=UPI00053CBE9A|nr:PREDICTED: zinc finger protein PLAG1 isoform X3 [Haliaeetus leucocephalus]
MAVARVMAPAPRHERRAELGAAVAADRSRWCGDVRGTVREPFALRHCWWQLGRVHRHSLDGHYCLRRTRSCSCEYMLTWDLCGQHFLKNHSFHRTSKNGKYWILVSSKKSQRNWLRPKSEDFSGQTSVPFCFLLRPHET